MARNVYLVLIVAGCIITGCLNSLLTKYQDNQCVSNCANPDPSKRRNFEQPVLQTLQMFVGEFCCYFIYRVIRSRGNANTEEYAMIGKPGEGTSVFRRISFCIPAICDMTATTLINVGLLYTPVSIYQMMRGSIVIFVAMLSVVAFRKSITKLEWVSLLLIVLGIGIVGFSGSQNSDDSEPVGTSPSPESVIFGIGLIIFGELNQAFQFLFEEKLLEDQLIGPITMVYAEGFYGSIIVTVVMIVMNFFFQVSLPKEQFASSSFNIYQALSDLFSSKQILISSILIMVAIASFNVCGVTLTAELSATSRSTIDTCRTLLVWLFAMIMGWEKFHFLQLIGFSVLVLGTLTFNKVLEPEEWNFVPGILKS